MASHYSSIGFLFRSEGEFQRATAELAAKPGQRIETRQGTYLRCASESGAELWLQVNKRGELIGAHPHYHGDGAVAVNVMRRVRNGDDTALDGAFHAWANPRDDIYGDYPFVFDCANFRELSAIALPAIGSVQITAFAHEISWHESPEQYAASQTEEIKFASQSFIPTGSFGEKGQTPTALAMFTGHVLRAERKRNELGGGDFIAALVETLGGTYDVVVDPQLLARVPEAGNVLSGSFYLSGYLPALASKATWRGKLMHRVWG
jgi:hypothetical protein